MQKWSSPHRMHGTCNVDDSCFGVQVLENEGVWASTEVRECIPNTQRLRV